MAQNPELSVIVLASRPSRPMASLEPLVVLLNDLQIAHEIVLLTPRVDPSMEEAARRFSVRIIEVSDNQYGDGLRQAFAEARGDYCLTLDADVWPGEAVIRDLWQHRHAAEIVVASRTMRGSDRPPLFSGEFISAFISWAANRFMALSLDLPCGDLSGGICLYKAAALCAWDSAEAGESIFMEILVWAFTQGRTIQEIPVYYAAHRRGDHPSIRMRVRHIKTFWKLWRLRNSILSADYDARAYNSRIPLQRYWQRRRFRHVTELTLMDRGPVLDVGCGSSFIIQALPKGSVALDVLARKLRYARRFGKHLIQASGFNLPFPDGCFACVICSQVIEHIPKNAPILDELCRVLSPGGRLVLGTPDYDHWEWVVVEKLYGWAAPGAYAEEHITRYTYRELRDWFESRGYGLEATRYILRGELIIALRKPAPTPKT